jgi:Domain of unknown function (DUF6379)
MFDRFLVVDDGLRNDSVEGEAVGFLLVVRHANYRGVYLSMHNGYYLSVDGVDYPREVQSFEINGKPPRRFEALKSAVWEHWDYDDAGILHIAKPGGLAPGAHEVRLQQSVLAAYGYRPTDEEWVKNPPVPGSGAGSDKSPDISTYTLTLSE